MLSHLAAETAKKMDHLENIHEGVTNTTSGVWAVVCVFFFSFKNYAYDAGSSKWKNDSSKQFFKARHLSCTLGD